MIALFTFPTTYIIDTHNAYFWIYIISRISAYYVFLASASDTTLGSKVVIYLRVFLEQSTKYSTSYIILLISSKYWHKYVKITENRFSAYKKELEQI